VVHWHYFPPVDSNGSAQNDDDDDDDDDDDNDDPTTTTTTMTTTGTSTINGGIRAPVEIPQRGPSVYVYIKFYSVAV
jgi:hypothetical protein